MPHYGPRKYDPLTRYLAALTVDEVTLTFPGIEAIIGAPLPASASLSSFWPRTSRSLVARPWVRARWRVARAQLRVEPPVVTFVRVEPS